MQLLLPFDEYCDLTQALRAPRSIGPGLKSSVNLNILRAKALFITDPTQIDLLDYLLNLCKPDEISELMKFFDKTAPIQKILEEHLKELETQELPYKDASAASKLDLRPEQSRAPSVYEILIEEMQKKGYETDADFYNHIGLDRRTFGKLRKADASISRELALWFAVGLELNYSEANEFLAKMGYAFKSTSDREQLIVYTMRTRKYTFKNMQQRLFSFGYKMFGEVEVGKKCHQDGDPI